MMLFAGISRVCCVSAVLIASNLSAAEAPGVLEEKVRTCVARLNAPDFRTREKATEELADLLPQARELLEKALQGPGLTDEQKERIHSLLKEGKCGIWARRSGLPEGDIDLLRQLRGRKVERQRSFEQLNRIEQMFTNENLTDPGLALIVWSICSQIPGDKENSGFEPWQLGQMFARALDLSMSGPSTAEALGRWVDEWMIPGLALSGESSASGAHRTDMQVFSRLLVADVLPADRFRRAWQGLVSQMQTPRKSNRRLFSEYSLGQWFILGFLNSRLTQPNDLNELITALLYTADSSSGMSMSYGYDPGMLRYVIASSRLSDLQMRSIGDWLILQYDSGRSLRSLNDPLRLLTGTTVWKAEDGDLLKRDREEIQHVYGQRWQEWWKTHRNSIPSGGVVGPEHRFVSAGLTTKDGKTTVTLKSDVSVREGRGTLIRHPETFSAEWVLVLGGEGIREWGIELPAEIQKQILLLESNELGGAHSSWISGSRPIVEGDVDVTPGARGQRVMGRGVAAAREPGLEATVRMLLAPDSGVTAEQVKTPAFWEDRLIQTAVRFERWADRSDKEKLPTILLGAAIRGLDSLENYRTPGIEKRVSELQKDASPHIASNAGFLLARWELKPDQARMIELLASPDAEIVSHAASALTLSGDMRGIESLVDQVARNSAPGGRLLLALSQTADEPRLSADQRMRGAVLIIERLVPKAETVEQSATIQALLARRWIRHDFGYRVGAKPEDNSKALQRYHEWAQHPKPITQPSNDAAEPDAAE